MSSVDLATGGSAVAGGSSTATRSGTNNQVLGVDEPDLLKLDNRYVYIVTPTELLILDAQNPATTTSASRITLEGTPKSLLVSGDRALVIASTGTVPQKAKCTYAYDCQFSGDGYGTLLLVLDISDRTKPRLIRRVRLSGSYLAGRMIGSVAHIVTSNVFKTPLISWSYPSAHGSTAVETLATLNSQYQSAVATARRRRLRLRSQRRPTRISRAMVAPRRRSRSTRTKCTVRRVSQPVY